MPDLRCFQMVVRVFGIPAVIQDGQLKLMVQICPDQEREWKRAEIDPRSDVKIITCLGGLVLKGEDLFGALARMVREIWGDGIEITTFFPFSQLKPLSCTYFPAQDTRVVEMCAWMPIVQKKGKETDVSIPSNLALISKYQLVQRTEYRCSAGRYEYPVVEDALREAFEFYSGKLTQKHLFFVL